MQNTQGKMLPMQTIEYNHTECLIYIPSFLGMYADCAFISNTSYLKLVNIQLSQK